ncbi:MAG TPA: TolC family protein [Pirellulales bacterium]|nr:TolC family protein [Pirellulales bacterium]
MVWPGNAVAGSPAPTARLAAPQWAGIATPPLVEQDSVPVATLVPPPGSTSAGPVLTVHPLAFQRGNNGGVQLPPPDANSPPPPPSAAQYVIPTIGGPPTGNGEPAVIGNPMSGRGLRLPAELPGASAPPLSLPPYDPTHPQDRLAAIDRLFPNLPPLPTAIVPQPGPEGRPMRLDEFENIGLANSPIIQQALAQITAERGDAIQQGTAPNPLVGYEADTVGSQRTLNYQGGYFEQNFKTAGKLQLAQAAQTIDVHNAELTLRRQRISVITTVQSRYYAVLVAEEAVRATQALAAFTEEAYRVQREQLRGGEAAAYEPVQLSVLAYQARAALVQARNRYFAAWKQLAAAISVPDMPPTQLAGSLEVEVPPVRFDVALARALDRHTDILSARNSVTQARINVRLAEVTPIPDLHLYFALQKDFTGPPFGTTWNTQVGLPLPFYDRNIGGIMQARGLLVRANQEAARVRNDLVIQATDAFERYENNRNVLVFYRQQMLPDQARVYRGVWERHQQQPDRVSFGDVIVAQQNLANTVTNYITVLGNQWVAVADLENVLQVEDLPELAQLGTPVAEPTMAPPPDQPLAPEPTPAAP